jgi:hypothetical protein
MAYYGGFEKKWLLNSKALMFAIFNCRCTNPPSSPFQLSDRFSTTQFFLTLQKSLKALCIRPYYFSSNQVHVLS